MIFLPPRFKNFYMGFVAELGVYKRFSGEINKILGWKFKKKKKSCLLIGNLSFPAPLIITNHFPREILKNIDPLFVDESSRIIIRFSLAFLGLIQYNYYLNYFPPF